MYFFFFQFKWITFDNSVMEIVYAMRSIKCIKIPKEYFSPFLQPPPTTWIPTKENIYIIFHRNLCFNRTLPFSFLSDWLSKLETPNTRSIISNDHLILSLSPFFNSLYGLILIFDFFIFFIFCFGTFFLSAILTNHYSLTSSLLITICITKHIANGIRIFFFSFSFLYSLKILLKALKY